MRDRNTVSLFFQTHEIFKSPSQKSFHFKYNCHKEPFHRLPSLNWATSPNNFSSRQTFSTLAHQLLCLSIFFLGPPLFLCPIRIVLKLSPSLPLLLLIIHIKDTPQFHRIYEITGIDEGIINALCWTMTLSSLMEEVHNFFFIIHTFVMKAGL